MEDVFSNLEEEVKEEAREVFIGAVESGLLLKNCISEVHEKVRDHFKFKYNRLARLEDAQVRIYDQPTDLRCFL